MAFASSNPPSPSSPLFSSFPEAETSIPVNATPIQTEIPTNVTPPQTDRMLIPTPNSTVTLTPTLMSISMAVTLSTQSSTFFLHAILEKLTNSNYLLWCQQVEPVLKGHHLHHFLVNLLIPPRFRTLADCDL